MLFSRAWWALMRRNMIYRRRNWIGTFLELFIPLVFVYLIVWIKDAVGTGSETREANITETAVMPLTFTDYVTAMQTSRVCVNTPPPPPPNTSEGEEFDYDEYFEDYNEFMISGLGPSSKNWPIPFVKCDARNCREVDEDAQPYCEYAMLALAGEDDGGTARAQAFRDWLYQQYPVLNGTASGSSSLPFDFEFVQLFDNSKAMNRYAKSSRYGKTGFPKIGMGIVFEGNDPLNVKYSLRQNSTNFNAPEEEARPGARTTPRTDIAFDIYAKTEEGACYVDDGQPRQGRHEKSCTGQYMYNGILTFQRLVHDFIMATTTFANDDTDASVTTTPKDEGYFVAEAGVQFAPFPTRPYQESGFFEDIAETVSLMFTLGFLYPVAAMIGYITREKDLRQKELMKMMSVNESDIGWSWFVTFFIVNGIAATLAALGSRSLYENSDGILIWAFWIVSWLAITTFSMALSTISSKPTRATLIGLLFFFIGSFLTLAADYQTGDAGLIQLVSMHPIAGFSYGLLEMGRLEDAGVGVTSSSAGDTENPSEYNFNSALNALAFDAIFWGIVYWYAVRVIRPDYGQALPWYFPFQGSYWCPSSASARGDVNADNENAANGDGQNDENVPVEPVGDTLKRQAQDGTNIEIRDLKKDFGEKVAVDGLTLSMYSGQITALLGHNGAGKTTTINMLTGAMEPSSGYATIAGKDIRTQMQSIREDIGICLQHDCLFPQLTVREHVQFFARLKGLYSKLSPQEAEQQIDQAIADVALSEKRNTLSRNLSGGMKRKLSVAIAFCGGSKVVLLDEPTSGMDPFSRRFTWNVIRQYRAERCIILTTHFMDEADILGDRIAIMAEGRLRCAGSSLFLKKTYGVGYQLTIEKHHNGNAPASSTHGKKELDEEDLKLQEIVTGAVPEAGLLSNVGTELSYQLPLGASSQFIGMFEGLDAAVENGTVTSYGVGITTLDEVFLLVARGDHPEEKDKKEYASSKRVDMADMTDDEKSVRSRMNLDQNNLFARHMGALFRKRAANFKRDKKAWCCTTVLPSLFVLFGFMIYATVYPDRDLDPLLLTLDEYNKKVESTATRPRNPVSFNVAGENGHSCQPGVCAYQNPVQQDAVTGETYYFCGYQGRFGLNNENDFDVPTNETCSISISNDTIEWIEYEDAGVVPQETQGSSVYMASALLLNSSDDFAASQYGAIFFSHDIASTIDGDNGTSTNYTSEVAELCYENNGDLNYTTADECQNLGGIGYVIHYNFTALHSGPMFQVLADEAIMREALQDPEFKIECTIAPLGITKVEEEFVDAENAFMAWFLVVLGFPFICGSFGAFVVEERESKSKHLQTVGGVSPAAYWVSTYLWDVSNYLIPMGITVALTFVFDVDVLNTTEGNVLSGVLAILLLFGTASAGLTYCISFLFKSPSYCNMFIIISGFLVAFGGSLTVFILTLLGEDRTNPRSQLLDVANIMTWILRFYPPFNLGKGLFYALNLESLRFIEGDQDLSVWSEPVLLYEAIFLALESVGYLLLAIQIDIWSSNPRVMRLWRTLTCRNLCARNGSGVDITVALPDDDDVFAEQERVLSGGANKDLIVISQMSKIYDNGKKAVNNMSLGIPPGECFGLLGINGAGKTTTMAMLTAEFPPTLGDATLAGFSIVNEPQKIRRRIGYCPQFDAHFPNLTGREHVELYAAIKGIPQAFVKDAVSMKLKEVGLSETDSDRVTSRYSGGMRRRLSLACATIGQPQIVFLDECSTGVDPVARREIWQLVSDLVSAGDTPEERASVILTTHSMEECEALCPRIGIMANGRLRCLGSAQRLKSKFGQGYQVEMKVQMVEEGDADYQENLSKLKSTKEGKSDSEVEASSEEMSFNLDEASAGLRALTNDDFLVSMLAADNPIGYPVFKDANSPTGVNLRQLVVFATTELRMRRLAQFVQENYPQHVLRERQDTKVRYEISSENVRISSIFALVEENKEKMYLSDYGVSQTSLEQVFNMHAAEAEKLKQGRDDH